MTNKKCIAIPEDKLKKSIGVTVNEALPIIVGPSSSHTYGPYLIGKSIRRELEKYPSDIKNIKIVFYNSMADTGVGHMADIAILGGLLGLELGSIKDSINWLRGNHGLLGISGKSICFDINTDLIYQKGDTPSKHVNAIELIINPDNDCVCMDWKSIGGGVIEPPFVVNKYNILDKSSPFFVNSWKMFREKAIKFDGPIISYIMHMQEALNPQHNYTYFMQKVFESMKKSVDDGLAIKGDKLPSGDMRAYAGDKYIALNKKLNNSNHYLQSELFAEAASENNAMGGVIVAAPTGGGGGVLPGIIVSLSNQGLTKRTEQGGIPLRKLYQSLSLAGIVKQIFQKNASVSGAVAGCTFEVGVGATMAAAAATYAHQNDSDKASEKKANLRNIELAMMNVFHDWIGIPCDPYNGRVEIPCIRRNGKAARDVEITVSNLLVSRTYLINFDDFDKQIAYAFELGMRLPASLRETSLKGTAVNIRKEKPTKDSYYAIH